MTKEEAIKMIENDKRIHHDFLSGKYRQALTMAVEALKERPSGHWIHDTHYGLNLPEHKCSECGTWEYSDEESNFCPHCGADMRGED